MHGTFFDILISVLASTKSLPFIEDLNGADKAAAAEGQAEATAKMEEFGDMKMKSTDILGKGNFKVDQSPLPFVAEAGCI